MNAPATSGAQAGAEAGARFAAALAAIDAVNAEDPAQEVHDGAATPAALLYGRRMSAWIVRLRPDASEVLRLAARAQHIARWKVPRNTFPEGRAGYLAWRTRLGAYHGEIAARILKDAGYGDAAAERIQVLLQKKGLKRDEEVQALEDSACLVFLQHQFPEFAAKHPEDKVIDILRKTWTKMSPAGHAAAQHLAGQLPEGAQALIARALA